LNDLKSKGLRLSEISHKKNEGSASPIIQLPMKEAREGNVEYAFPKKEKQQKPKLRPQLLRRYMLALSFLLAVVIPGIFGSIYYLTIASDRYAASASFTVRSMDGLIGGGDILSSFTGLTSTGSTTSDSYIILRYLKSRELIDKLDSEFDLETIYSRDDADFIYRMKKDLPVEEVMKYWEGMIATSYDSASAIISFEVQAFTSEDAEKIAAAIVRHCQELVNKLSKQAREDAVLFAKKEVSATELRLKLIRQELRELRAKTSAIDPTAAATAQAQLVIELEREIINRRAQLSTISDTLNADAPSIVQLKREIASLETQLAAKRSEVGGEDHSKSPKSSSLAGIIADFERLGVEQEFANQAYTVTLASLARARAEADRQQRFLAVFHAPAKPQDALYPERIFNSFLVFGALLLIWSIGVLIVYSVRDHLR